MFSQAPAPLLFISGSRHLQMVKVTTGVECVSLLPHFCWELTKQDLLISERMYSPVKPRLDLNKNSPFSHLFIFKQSHRARATQPCAAGDSSR